MAGGNAQSEILVFSMERFHSRSLRTHKFIRTIESVCIRKYFYSHMQRSGTGPQHFRDFIVILLVFFYFVYCEYQYGRRNVK